MSFDKILTYVPSRSKGDICKCKQTFRTLRNSFFHKLYERLYETIITKLEKKSEKNEELELLWHEGNLLKGIEKKTVKR